uniref:Zinc finger and BTB domain containing 22a n=1 Tax=Nothobranchius furzeri TaxID=105023 RepID=A0A8C6PUW1_NOTFU
MDPSCCDAVAPPGLTVQVCFPGARAAVLDNLNRQREEGRLCDLSIQVQGQVFRAHRCVLAASSPYFHDQVLLKNVTTVSLPSVMDPVAFESVLSSAYTGQLSIVHEDIVNYVTVASFLQMWHIVDKCTEILKRPRSSGETPAGAPPGPASRQQSPSSTECLFRGAPLSAEREHGRTRDGEDTLDRRRTERRGAEADEGVGEEEERRDGFTHTGNTSPKVLSGTPTSTHHVSPSSAAFPPPPSPPTPSSSSSSAPLSGSAYSGKVHFCHCGKAYTLKSMRDRHVKMQHLNLRPFGCPVCTKSFKMKHHLTKHLKTHGGLRPYECSLCGKKVIWRDSFLRHQARCERLASSTGPAPPYGFDVPLGQVKVEEGDLHRAVGGLLDLVGTESQNLGQVFKEEAAESFSGS